MIRPGQISSTFGVMGVVLPASISYCSRCIRENHDRPPIPGAARAPECSRIQRGENGRPGDATRNEFPLEQPGKLTAGVYYWTAIWSDDTNARVYYTSQSGVTLKWAPYAYGESPDPIALDANGNTYLDCIYAEGAYDG